LLVAQDTILINFLKKKKKILNNSKVLSQVLLSVVTTVVSGITVSNASVQILGEAGNVGMSVSFGTEYRI